MGVFDELFIGGKRFRATLSTTDPSFAMVRLNPDRCNHGRLNDLLLGMVVGVMTPRFRVQKP